MKKQMPYSTPEGYFESLQDRLSEIPVRKSRINLTPYLALAASFALALLAGNYILMKTAGSQSASDEEIVEYLIDSGTTLAQLEDAVYEY
jgi:hypothetical protein